MDDRAPCEVCNRFHRGPRCRQKRGVTIAVHMPEGVHRLLLERVPWGERSRFVARAVENALEAE